MKHGGGTGLAVWVGLVVTVAGMRPASAASFAVVDWGGNYVSANQNSPRAITTENQAADYGGNPVIYDARKYIPFDETELFSPASGYSGTSAAFYGGWNSIVYDTASGGTKPQAQCGIFDVGSADTIRFRGGNGLGEAAAVAVWRKADFLTGAGKPLTLRSDSTLQIYVADVGLGTGGDAAFRLVVKNGSQYFVSNTASSSTGWLTIANPTSETWATFNPANGNNRLIDFGTTYATRTFDDVQAIGYCWSGTIGGNYTASPQVQEVEFQASFAAATGTVVMIQ